MQVLIEIDERFYQWVKMCGLMPFITQGKVIPEDATNDDFFKAVLDEKGYRAIHDRFIGTKWLFAPYKGGE